MIQIAWGMVFVGAISLVFSYLLDLHHVDPVVYDKSSNKTAEEVFEEDESWWREIFDCYD